MDPQPLPVQCGATPELAQDLPALAYLTMPRCRSARYWELRPTGLGRSPRGVGTARETLLHARASLLRLGDETLSRLGRREAPSSLSASSPAMRARFVFGGGILEARYDYGTDGGPATSAGTLGGVTLHSWLRTLEMSFAMWGSGVARPAGRRSAGGRHDRSRRGSGAARRRFDDDDGDRAR